MRRHSDSKLFAFFWTATSQDGIVFVILGTYIRARVAKGFPIGIDLDVTPTFGVQRVGIVVGEDAVSVGGHGW